MKKIKFNNKLFIDQTIIAQLDENQMAGINGGAKDSSKPATQSCLGICTYTCPLPTWAQTK